MTRIEADWLTDDATQRVFALLGDYPSFAVGGCVRNTILGAPVKDIDLSTAARPEVVTALAEAAGLRVVPTGIEHGTVTVVVGDEPFEITTFRRDVETDGRRAVVAFSDRIEEDALRRDFTMNALYADAAGVVHDPVGGLADIAARRVRFIEDAVQRIREDYLRSLRFFRFCAWYGDPESGMDSDALDAIARNLAGLETLSRERVGSELLRLLGAPKPAPAVASMRATGVLGTILPGADDRALGPLVELERGLGLEPNAVRRLAVLGGAFDTLRLSRSVAKHVETVRDSISVAASVAGYRHGDEIGRDIVLVTAALMEQPLTADALADVVRGATFEFPVKAADLMPALEGKALGEVLKRLEDRWIKSGFTLSKSELLSLG